MSNQDAQPVAFTQKQYDYLNKMFPERTGTPTTTNDELRFYAGQRSMIQFLQSKVKGQ